MLMRMVPEGWARGVSGFSGKQQLVLRVAGILCDPCVAAWPLKMVCAVTVAIVSRVPLLVGGVCWLCFGKSVIASHVFSFFRSRRAIALTELLSMCGTDFCQGVVGQLATYFGQTIGHGIGAHSVHLRCAFGEPLVRLVRACGSLRYAFGATAVRFGAPTVRLRFAFGALRCARGAPLVALGARQCAGSLAFSKVGGPPCGFCSCAV